MRLALSKWSLALVVCSLVLAATSAQAQATRTWVSGVGDDANPCSRTAPCKTFAGAYSKTAPAGEIDVLDPGGFGAVTITKSITIDARAAIGGVVVSGTNGIVVSAGSSDVVILRGLDLNGLNSSLAGVKFNSGAALHVEDSTIAEFATGIDATAAIGLLHVKNTSIRLTSGSAIAVGSSASATVEKSAISGAAVGIDASGSARVAVHDTVVSGCTTAGVQAAGTAQVNMDHGLVAYSAVGVQGNSATVRLSEVMLSGNTTGIAGNVASFGNNRVAAGNTTDGAPSSLISQQ